MCDWVEVGVSDVYLGGDRGMGVSFGWRECHLVNESVLRQAFLKPREQSVQKLCYIGSSG